MTPKGHSDLVRRRDLVHDLKVQVDHWPWSWPKGQAFDLADINKCPGNTKTKYRTRVNLCTLSEYAVSSCSFLDMLTIALPSVIW